MKKLDDEEFWNWTTHFAGIILTIIGILKPHINRVNTADANTMRYQTSDMASMDMSFPRMAVNPKMKTIP